MVFPGKKAPDKFRTACHSSAGTISDSRAEFKNIFPTIRCKRKAKPSLPPAPQLPPPPAQNCWPALYSWVEMYHACPATLLVDSSCKGTDVCGDCNTGKGLHLLEPGSFRPRRQRWCRQQVSAGPHTPPPLGSLVHLPARPSLSSLSHADNNSMDLIARVHSGMSQSVFTEDLLRARHFPEAPAHTVTELPFP